MPNHAEQARSMFMSALEKYSPDQWPAFLDGACRDDVALRERVQQLLQAHVDMGSIHTSAQEPTINHPPLEQPGAQIGPYKLLEQIGEGGMGIVYVASQREPLRRRVALKIIKPGMDSREVVARFEAERQALALMDHPNIAKVFDAGATDAGRPYFVMELVQGTPITEYCDRQQLSTRERLALFVTLCHGVQHAHQKGVIHRDLKPSHLLIEVHDVRPVPKIIDFGIAKAVGQQLTEKTFYTAQSQMVGTPLYMSPEQAGQSCKDVDTRSDIYSLGVLLYELLTGHTPFEKDTLRTAGVDEMRRIIREVEPPRPSARVSTLQAADLSTVCDRRNVEPHKLSQELRGELDWIVMKAMDKDRDRRYATVNDLAADVERYLHDEPVQACPPSAAYRFTKFARRNQVALVTSGLVALALIAGTGVSIWQAIRATNAELAAITQRDAKDRAEQQTAQSLLKAQERLQFGRRAVDDMYTQVAEKWLAQQAELTLVQRQFLEKALAFYQQLATEQSDDPTVRFETAKAQQRVGEIQKKLGQHKEAEATFRQAVGLFQQLVRVKPDEPQYRQSLAQTLTGLGDLLHIIGRYPEAERELRLALDTHQTLVTQFPDKAAYQANLAAGHEILGELLLSEEKFREAEVALRQSLALLESMLTSSPDERGLKVNLARTRNVLARTLVASTPPGADNPVEAEALLHAAIDSLTALVAEDPKDAGLRQQLACSHESLALLFDQLRRPLEAETSYRQAVSIYRELTADVPDVPSYRWALGKSLFNRASTMDPDGRTAEGEQLRLQSQEILDKLAADYPDVPDYQNLAGDNRITLAHYRINQGKLEEARDLLERTIAQKQAAAKSNPDNPFYYESLPVALDNLGVALVKSGRFDEGATAMRNALELEERIVARSPSNRNRWEDLRRTSANLANLLQQRGQLSDAEAVCRRSLDLTTSLLTNATGTPQLRMILAELSDRLGRLCHQVQKLPDAEQAGRRAVEIQNALAADQPDDVEVRKWAGAYLSNLADTLTDAGQLAEARQFLEQALVHQRAALKIDPTHVQSQDFLNNHLVLLTEVLVLLGDDEAAAQTAHELAQLDLLPDGDQFVVAVAQVSEAWIEQAEKTKNDAERSPQRRESGAGAYLQVATALIREAVQRAPDNPNLYLIAALLSTAPEPLRDPDLALRLARRAVELKPENGMYLQSLGWALWRSGDFKGAIEILKKQADCEESGFVLAMACWQLGEKDEAQTYFDSANAWLPGYEQRCEEALKQGRVKYPLPVQLKRLQAEAAALLGVTPPTVAPVPASAAKVEEAQELPKSAPAPEAPKEEEKPQ